MVWCQYISPTSPYPEAVQCLFVTAKHCIIKLRSQTKPLVFCLLGKGASVNYADERTASNLSSCYINIGIFVFRGNTCVLYLFQIKLYSKVG